MQNTVHWVGEIDPTSPALGLPVLAGVETVELYRATPEHGTYSHHGYVFRHGGTLFAAWSNHAADEDASGQRVLWSRSADDGRTWTAWRELFPPQDAVEPAADQDWREDWVLIANGFATADGTLYAIAEVHVLQDRRGPGRIARAIAADGSTGPIFWLRDDPPPPRPGFPAHPPASTVPDSAAINACLARPEHWPSWEFRDHATHPLADDGHRLCEPTQGWRIADGTWVRLYRDLGDPPSGRKYAQFSADDGLTWTVPVQTDFPDANARSAAGQLPDGTAYVINNPGSGRDPLVISLARDGLCFDRHAVLLAGAPPRRHEGRWKGLGFQYPRAVVAGDALVVIYSINKEDMAVSRLPLAALDALS